MLPRANRLTSSDVFRRTIRAGVRAGATTLVVHYLPPPVPPAAGPGSTAAVEPRVGFVVSKAVGGSVVRHRVQRRLRHLVRPHLARLAGSGTLVVRALPPSARAGSGTLDADLDACLRRVLQRRAA